MVVITVLAVAIACTGCGKEEDRIPLIEGLTRDNFPVMDGSTSTDPLVRLAAARLLGYNAEWKQENRAITWNIVTDLPQNFAAQHLKCSQTHNAFVNLIDKRADMIFSARTMSADEKAYAAEAGVSLVETPIALDALVFIKQDLNPVTSLTHQQLQDIYTAKIKNWGGDVKSMLL
jgi:phosphate transport system substrate-binding protein